MRTPAGRVLVAGIGNVFLGDDGFGPAVVGRLGRCDLPGGVDVADYGVSGVHLAYELLDGRHESLVLVDAVPMGEAPGTLAVLAVDEAGALPGPLSGGVDAHAMGPAAVLSALVALGGRFPRVRVVGCQPGDLEAGMSLSAPVAASLEAAARLVASVAREEVARGA